MKKLLCLLGCILTVWLIQSANSSETEKFVFKDTVSVLNVREIDGDVWLCTSEGAYLFDGENYTRIPDQNLTVWDIRKAGDALWLMSTDGAYRVDGSHVRRIPDKNLHINGIQEVEGRVFLNTNNGTYIVEGGNAYQYPEGEQYTGSVLSAGGVTWVRGFLSWGAYAVDGPEILSDLLKGMKIRNVIPIGESAWILTEKGAIEIREGHILRHILKNEEVFDAADSPRGLFFGTRNGAYLLKDEKTSLVFEDEEEDGFRIIYVSKESVWLFSNNKTYCVDDSGIREVEDIRVTDLPAIDSCINNVLYSGMEVQNETTRKPRDAGTSATSCP